MSGYEKEDPFADLFGYDIIYDVDDGYFEEKLGDYEKEDEIFEDDDYDDDCEHYDAPESD